MDEAIAEACARRFRRVRSVRGSRRRRRGREAGDSVRARVRRARGAGERSRRAAPRDRRHRVCEGQAARRHDPPDRPRGRSIVSTAGSKRGWRRVFVKQGTLFSTIYGPSRQARVPSSHAFVRSEVGDPPVLDHQQPIDEEARRILLPADMLPRIVDEIEERPPDAECRHGRHAVAARARALRFSNVFSTLQLQQAMQKKAVQAVWMSADWMRFTPASVICFHAAASEPLRSMARVASSIT